MPERRAIFPNHFPDLKTFVQISNIVTGWGAEIPEVDEVLIHDITQIMTPIKSLSSSSLDKARVIDPNQFPDFDSLLCVRNQIKNLQLVAHRPEWLYNYYQSLDREDILHTIRHQIRDTRFCLLPQTYDLNLPPLLQRVLWIHNPYETNTAVASFIGKVMVSEGLGMDDIILHEKINGTIPEIRHVHMWTRGEPDVTSGWVNELKK